MVVISLLVPVITRSKTVINSPMAVIIRTMPVIKPIYKVHSQYGMLYLKTESSHKGE